MKMVWLSLVTLSIGVFVLECLFLIFCLRLTYDMGVLVALANTLMGFGLGIAAHMRQRPPEAWLLYGAVLWPLSVLHFLMLRRAKARQSGSSASQNIGGVTPLAEKQVVTADASLVSLPADRFDLNGS